jgi:hypothetical protein
MHANREVYRHQGEFGREEKRHVWATIAAAAIGAAATAGSAAYSAHSAGQAAKAGQPSSHKFPLPPRQQGFENYYTRLLAQNLTQTPPSFVDYINSGGKARFPLVGANQFTPQEARKLGIVDRKGNPVPFLQQGQTSLTPEQQLYLGYLGNLSHSTGPLARAYQVNQNIKNMTSQPQTPGRVAREDTLRARRDRFLADPSGGLA